MSKINGLPDARNYFYGADVGEPLRSNLFMRPVEDYADIRELEMVAGCVGCHDSNHQSELTVALGDREVAIDDVIRAAYIEDASINNLNTAIYSTGEPPAFLKQGPWGPFIADAPDDLDEVMAEIPRDYQLMRRIYAGIAVFWIVAILLITWAAG